MTRAVTHQISLQNKFYFTIRGKFNFQLLSLFLQCNRNMQEQNPNQSQIGTSEKLLTSIIKQNWRQESIGVHVQNIQNFLIADREPIKTTKLF